MKPQRIPEQGEIVTVRQRTYTVTDVRQNANQSTRLEQKTHLVSLTSVEDDALGESLQVIWETEVGVEIPDKVDLPDPTRFDSPDVLDSFLDAVRWGAASQADRANLQAPFRSGIKLEDYQLNPLVRAVQMPRVSLLIADDVGLGKTVEAGLIVQELMTRNRVRTSLIICPSGLQLHWRDQMQEKFGLEFRIIDSDMMKGLRRTRGIHVNPWSHFPRLITSMDFIKRERPLRLFIERVQGKPTYPRPFDMLIVDEAHNVAPAGSGQYAVDSQRTQAIRAIVPYFEHHLFLSATPHNGYSESFTALLELLDNQRFARGVQPDPRQLEAVMVRRLKRDLTNSLGEPRFENRVIQSLEVAYTPEERQVYAWLNQYGVLRRENAVTQEDKFASEFVLKLLKKRLLSSPHAFYQTLGQHLETMTKAAPSPISARDKTAYGILKRQIALLQEDHADDDEYEAQNEQALTVVGKAAPTLSSEERRLIDQMMAWAKHARDHYDSKTKHLLGWLKQVVKPDGVWNNERVILFTEYRATQKWLLQVLNSAGLADAERVKLIYGGMDGDERESIKAAFQATPSPDNKVRILLATDAASEGIDLQNHCHRLVHIEIPWNPNRMEQRNGRIDRMGQNHAPEIYHFVPQGYQSAGQHDWGAKHSVNDLEGDLEFLMRAVEKVEQIREDLMGKVGDVIAHQVEEAMLGMRKRLDIASVEEKTRPAKALYKLDRKLDERIQAQIQAFYKQRHSLRLTPEHVQGVVEVALELSNQPPLQPAAQSGAFYVPKLRGAWERAKGQLAHPFTGIERPIVFDEKLLKNDSVVLAHLNHPLVLHAQRLLRAEIWSGQGKLSRVTARLIPRHISNTPVLVAYGRLVIIGNGRYRLHEELISAGLLLTYGNAPSARPMGVRELEAALDVMGDTLPKPAVLDGLGRHWEVFKPALSRALDSRKNDRYASIQKQLDDRMTTEITDMQAILGELAGSIERELKDPDIVQPHLPGFTDNERQQFERDVEALRHRLRHIPNEIAQEEAVIRSRYDNLEAHLFPAAITYLIPEHLG